MMAALLLACGDKDTGEDTAEEQDSAVEAEQNKKTPQGGMGLWMPHFNPKERKIIMEVKTNKKVSVHYIGTLNDGTEFDNSRKKGSVFSFQLGSNQVIAGFEEAVANMKVGETKKISLSPEQAYGEYNPSLMRTVSNETFPEDFEYENGAMIQMKNDTGATFPARIHSFTDNEVTLDFNHPMAGESLNFEIEVIEIEDEES